MAQAQYTYIVWDTAKSIPIARTLAPSPAAAKRAISGRDGLEIRSRGRGKIITVAVQGADGDEVREFAIDDLLPWKVPKVATVEKSTKIRIPADLEAVWDVIENKSKFVSSAVAYELEQLRLARLIQGDRQESEDQVQRDIEARLRVAQLVIKNKE